MSLSIYIQKIIKKKNLIPVVRIMQIIYGRGKMVFHWLHPFTRRILGKCQDFSSSTFNFSFSALFKRGLNNCISWKLRVLSQHCSPIIFDCSTLQWLGNFKGNFMSHYEVKYLIKYTFKDWVVFIIFKKWDWILIPTHISHQKQHKINFNVGSENSRPASQSNLKMNESVVLKCQTKLFEDRCNWFVL